MTLPAAPIAGQLGHDNWHRTLHPRHNATYHSVDYASLQAGVDAVASAGGGVLHVHGTYTLDAPLVLPRANAVRLRGDAPISTTITGSAEFPPDHGLIEWANETDVIAHQQSISNMTLIAPDVAGTSAIKYVPESLATVDDQYKNRLEISLSDLIIEGHNDYHVALVRVAGTLYRSHLSRLRFQPRRGDGTYQTRCISLDYGLGETFSRLNDVVGAYTSVFEDIYALGTYGGQSQLVQGRFVQSRWTGSYANGPLGTYYDIRNSSHSRFVDIGSEGNGGTPQYLFKDSVGCVVDGIAIGRPKAPYADLDCVGLQLENCQDMQLCRTREDSSKSQFSMLSPTHMHTVIDADCQRCTFDRWYVKVAADGSITDEITINAAADAGNQINYVAFVGATPQTGTLTTTE